MTSLSTAKVLLFIALSVGPKHPQTIFATSNSENYVWTQSGQEWSLKTKGLPTHQWRDRKNQPAPDPQEEREMRAVAHYDWREGSFLNLENGNRVERQGNAVFYIIDPGAPNQKVFTILYPTRK